MFKHYLYKLESGYTIVTPHNKEISKEECKVYFTIFSDWFKEMRPIAFESLKPNFDECNENMLNKLFKAYMYNSEEEGVAFFCSLDTRKLAFIYVISYFIQNKLTPLLAHVMGHALLEWLPIHELIEDYLTFSAQYYNPNDASYLASLFVISRYLSLNLLYSDVDKVYRYEKIAYENALNKSGLTLRDYRFARVMWDIDHKNAKNCMEILDRKLKVYGFKKPHLMLHYLNLKLEIYSTVKCDFTHVDLDSIEKILDDISSNNVTKNGCLYRLAMCYLNGINNPKSVDKAIKCVSKLIFDDFQIHAALVLAKYYLDKNNKEYDPVEALSVLRIVKDKIEINHFSKVGSDIFYNDFLDTYNNASKIMN